MRQTVAMLVLAGACAFAASAAAGGIEIAESESAPRAGGLRTVDGAYDRAMQWLQAHPAAAGGSGILEVAEEVMLFYALRAMASAPSERAQYLREIAARHAAMEPFNQALLATGQHLQGIWGPLTYLPLTHILAALDMDTTSYRSVVDDVLARHCLLHPSRIAMQLWIAVYMERLGYTPATPVAVLVERSKLGRNARSDVLGDRLDVDEAAVRQETIQLIYDLTHEVFALTDFGNEPAPAEMAALRDHHALLFDRAMRWAMRAAATDILAELVTAARLLGLSGLASEADAVRTILGAQHEDGSFGVTNPDRADGRRHGVLTGLLALKAVGARGDPR